MSSSHDTRAASFTKALRAVAVPRLKELGFAFDGSRTFRRFMDSGHVQIIAFQMGVTFMAGQFTVNLGVFGPEDTWDEPGFTIQKVREYHCHHRERLGLLTPNSTAALQGMPFLGFLFGKKDTWWLVPEGQPLMEARIQEVLEVIERYGLAWLSQPT